MVSEPVLGKKAQWSRIGMERARQGAEERRDDEPQQRCMAVHDAAMTLQSLTPSISFFSHPRPYGINFWVSSLLPDVSKNLFFSLWIWSSSLVKRQPAIMRRTPTHSMTVTTSCRSTVASMITASSSNWPNTFCCTGPRYLRQKHMTMFSQVAIRHEATRTILAWGDSVVNLRYGSTPSMIRAGTSMKAQDQMELHAARRYALMLTESRSWLHTAFRLLEKQAPTARTRESAEKVGSPWTHSIVPPHTVATPRLRAKVGERCLTSSTK
mmetsp:Transcript_78308/g.204126  ORF Transcript_78308/g.204126 Transcript_78308/m.204126 type:complete len:268 (-) Transcript_78308:453-1256(-)